MQIQDREHTLPLFMRGWQRVDNWIKSFERFLLVLGMGMIMVFGSLDIILRNIFGWGLMFADTLARQLTIWLGLLGASVAASSSEHISIDAFSYLLKRRGLQINKITIGAFSTLGSAVLTYCTVVFVQFYIGEHAITPSYVYLGYLKTPVWVWLLIFPFTFILITLRYLFATLKLFWIPTADPFQAEYLAETPADTVPHTTEPSSTATADETEAAAEQAQSTATGELTADPEPYIGNAQDGGKV